MIRRPAIFYFFFFNDTATTEIYTLSLHDALPILLAPLDGPGKKNEERSAATRPIKSKMTTRIGKNFFKRALESLDRKSTRLNSSHLVISYAVFCLKKKNTEIQL